jgi:hypothetical protein
MRLLSKLLSSESRHAGSCIFKLNIDRARPHDASKATLLIARLLSQGPKPVMLLSALEHCPALIYFGAQIVT